MPIAWLVAGAFLPPAAVGLSAGGAAQAERSVLEPFVYMLTFYGSWLLWSCQVAFIVVLAGMAIGAPAAYAIVRTKARAARVLEEVSLLPLSLPGISLSVALLAAYPSARGRWLVVAGHLLYTLPLFIRVATHALRTRDVEQLEDAARTLGASLLQRLLWIVLPSLRPALVLGSLLVFTVSFGELNVSYLLNAGQPQTFPAALYNTFANEDIRRASAATVIFLAGALPPLACIQWLDRDAAVRVEQGA